MHSTLQREIPATTTRYSFCAVGTYIHPIPGKLRGFSAQLQLVARYIELSNIHRDFCCLSKLYIPLSICKSRYFIQNKSMTISVLCLAIYAIYQTRCVSTPIKDKLDHYPPTCYHVLLVSVAGGGAMDNLVVFCLDDATVTWLWLWSALGLWPLRRRSRPVTMKINRYS